MEDFLYEKKLFIPLLGVKNITGIIIIAHVNFTVSVVDSFEASKESVKLSIDAFREFIFHITVDVRLSVVCCHTKVCSTTQQRNSNGTTKGHPCDLYNHR